MSENTLIEWTDHTFNPWIGCTKVSPGCDHCYAERREDKRLHRVQWGPGQPRHRTKTWGDPVRWNKQPFFECAECSTECQWRGTCDGESCPACGGHVVPARARVFCASLADVFDNEVPIEWLIDFLDMCRLTPNLDKLVLTKRIGNVTKRLWEAKRAIDFETRRELWLYVKTWENGEDPPRDVWIGATVVNQEEADRDIPKLLATPASVRFLSIEPMLGPIDLGRFIGASDHAADDSQPIEHCERCGCVWDRNEEHECPPGFGPRPDWVIVGGESGPSARPMHPDWARSLRDQCAEAGVPFLFKQWGEWAPISVLPTQRTDSIAVCRQDGSTMPVGQANARLDDGRRFHAVYRIGKKAAGRLLDGVQHDGFPV